MNRFLLPLAFVALAAGARAQLVFGTSATVGTNPGGSGAAYLDLSSGVAKQLWTGSASTGRVTGMTFDGTSLYTAASARFGKWQTGAIGQAPTQINGFYRRGSNGTVYPTGVNGLGYVPSGANIGIYGYTNYNASGSGPYVEDGIYRFDPSVTTSGAVNSTLVWRHDDGAYNFEGMAYNAADGLFYATNNPTTTGVAGAGIYSIDAFGGGAVTKVADYSDFITGRDGTAGTTGPSGLTIGDGRIWLSSKVTVETQLRITSLDLRTRAYGDALVVPGYSATSQFTALAWAPGAVPEPATLAALGFGAVSLLRRRRRA